MRTVAGWLLVAAGAACLAGGTFLALLPTARTGTVMELPDCTLGARFAMLVPAGATVREHGGCKIDGRLGAVEVRSGDRRFVLAPERRRGDGGPPADYRRPDTCTAHKRSVPGGAVLCWRAEHPESGSGVLVGKLAHDGNRFDVDCHGGDLPWCVALAATLEAR